MPYRSSRLSRINILLVDADEQLRELLRQVMASLGFGAIYLAQDGTEALALLQSREIDLVITDWDMRPMGGLEFIRHIRWDRDSPNRLLPIIMLTGRAKRQQVEQARDAGVTEFLIKPFNVRTLCDRIMLVIDHPRNFILAGQYAGPDRRRRQQPLEGRGDRRHGREAVLLAENDGTRVLRQAGEEIVEIDSDHALREKIGRDISLDELFSPENVMRAQRIIHQARGEYLEWVVQDLFRLDMAFRQLERISAHTPEEVAAVAELALRIKSQAGVFDYALASQVAESLYELCLDQAHLDEAALQAGRKHIDVLYVVFQRNIQGSGGVMGEELRESLAVLVQKARTP